MHRWHNTTIADKQIAYNQISRRIKLPAYAVEKDWWLVQTLTILFELEIGKHLVFKGGTSLSKAWGLIERFSEDVDLAVNRAFYGFEGELGKERWTKLRKKANLYIRETLFPELQKAFAKKGLTGVKIELAEMTTGDQDPVIINVNYPNVFESPGYIRPRVQIEIGCRSLMEPFEMRPLLSLVDEIYPEAPFSQKSVFIPSVVPERTFLEKIFLLHEEFKRPEDKIRVDRLSRHLYDLYILSKTEYAVKALSNKKLYELLVKHRFNFTRLGGVDYNYHQPQTINFIPDSILMPSWVADYKTMQEQMIHGESPGFEELIDALKGLNKKINSMTWKMDSVFPTL
jgi:hypothetical protein